MDQQKVESLRDALAMLKTLEIPEIAVPIALEYLLAGSAVANPAAKVTTGVSSKPSPKVAPPTVELEQIGELRAFLASKQPKRAMEEIPCLMSWATEHLAQTTFDVASIEKLYQEADLVPPRSIQAAMSDLTKKHYGRVERLENGKFRLSNKGAYFVRYDLETRKKEKS